MTAAIATAAAVGGTLTGFTPAILCWGSFVDGRAPLGGTLSVLDGMSTCQRGANLLNINAIHTLKYPHIARTLEQLHERLLDDTR